MKKLLTYVAFILCVFTVQSSFGQCIQNYSFTAYPAPTNGMYTSGETVTFCFQTDWEFDILNPEYLMGVEILLGNGWEASSISPGAIPSNCASFPENTISCSSGFQSGSWTFTNSYVNPETGNTMGPGFLYEDGNLDPTNYWGDPCALFNGTCVSTCFNFCFNVTVSDFASCINGEDLSVTINTLSDANAEIGNNSGGTNCAGDPMPSLSAISNCCNVSAGQDNCMTYCSDSSIGIINLNDLIDGENLGGDWYYNGMLLPSNFFNPANDPAGTYTYQVTGAGGCIDESSLDITINPFPDAGPPIFELEACEDFPVLNIINFFTPAPADPNGFWLDPNGNPWDGTYDADVDITGEYLYITNSNGLCPGDTVFVYLTSVPYSDPGSDNSISLCSGANTINLFDNLLGTPEIGGSWTDPNNNTLPGGHLGILDPSNAIAGTYTYTIANGTLNQCSSSAEIVVSIVGQLNAGINSSTSICSSAASINLFGFLNGGPDAGGSWVEQANGTPIPGGFIDPMNYPPNTAIIFEYTVGAGSVCENTAELEITFNISPQAGMTSGGLDQIISCGPVNVDFDFLFSDGTGPYDIVVTDSNGNTIISETGLVGNTYSTSILVNSSTTFYLTSFDDTGNSCIGFVNANNEINVIVNDPPDGSISLSGDVCVGNEVLVDLAFTGTGPFTAVIDISGAPNQIFPGLAANETVPILMSNPGTVNIALAEVIDANMPACTTATANSESIEVFEAPTLELITPDSICPGSQAQIEVDISGQWTNYSIWLSQNGNLFQFSNLNDGDFIDLPGLTTLTYCADSIVPMSFGQCVSQVSDCAEVYFSDNPQIFNADVECDPLTEEGIVTFDLFDGDSDNLTLNGIDGSLGISDFESNSYPNGEVFSINLEDEFGCQSNTLNININCSCVPSVSGSMNTIDTISTCENLAIDVANYFGNDSILQDGDILEFILHDNPGSLLGNVFASNSTPFFFFNNNLNYGQVYYISPVAGLNNGGNVNLADPCLSVGVGIPVVFYQIPEANFQLLSNTICPGETVDLSIDLLGEGPWTIEISDNNGPVAGSPFLATSNPFIFTANAEATYSIDLVSNQYCTGISNASQSQLIVNDLPELNISPLSVFCENDNNQLEFNFIGTGPWVLDYEWNGFPQPSIIFNNSIDNFDLNLEGTYVFTGVSDAFCSESLSDTVEIEFLENPLGSLSGGATFCEGDSTLIEFEFTGGTANYIFSYTDGLNNFGPFNSNGTYSFYAQNAGNYEIIALADDFCEGTFTGNAIVQTNEAPVVDFVISENEVCEDEIVTVTFAFNQNDEFSFEFFYPTDTLPLTVNSGHQLNWQAQNGGEFGVFNIINNTTNCANQNVFSENLIVNPIPSIDAGPDVFICPSDTTIIGGTPLTDVIYFWDNTAGLSNPFDGQTAVSLENSNDEMVTVEYVLEGALNGCSNSDTVQVTVYTNPLVNFYFNPDPVLLTDPLVNLINLSENNLLFEWNIESIGLSNEINPTVLFSEINPDNYEVCLTGIDQNSCASTFCSVIEVSGDPLVYIPNSFTPDGDGINDRFGPIITNGIPEQYEFRIFNRWGEEIFFSSRLEDQWNGSGFNPEYYALSDIYLWTLTFKNPFGAEILNFKGHVTLIR